MHPMPGLERVSSLKVSSGNGLRRSWSTRKRRMQGKKRMGGKFKVV